MGRKLGKSKYSNELKNHPLIRVWAGVISRCYSPSSSQFHRYGAVGVRVCDEWKNNFKAFYDWCMANGWQKKLQIDKDIKAKKLGIPPLLYSPETCCIVTPKENCNNRKSNRVIEYNGESKTLSQWAEIIGINRVTLSIRMSKLSIKESFEMPIDANSIKKRIVRENDGKIYDSVSNAAKELGVKTCYISRVLTNNRKSYKGYTFKYLNLN